MNDNICNVSTSMAGDHLKATVRVTSSTLLFFSLFGTGVTWAGTDSFNCSTIIWKTSLLLGLFSFALTWIVYLPFRNTDKLLGNGLLSIFAFLSIFWLFGFTGFYFYFLFAPINIWLRTVALAGASTSLIHRAYIINFDIKEAFRKNKKLFPEMYRDEGEVFTFSRQAVGLLEKARRNRDPFKSIHLYAAIILAPFILTLNRISTPSFGDGHGIFLFLAFLSLPILLWTVEIFTQTFITMVYYPIKIHRATGKQVLMKNW